MSKPIRLNKSKKNKQKNKKNKQTNDVTFLGKALRGLGALGGSTLGTMIGQPAAGQAVGSSLGAAISRWLGAGDYTISKNTVMRAGSTVPDMHRSDQSITVRHREFITQVTGANNFTVQYALTLNPGNSQTFPWLSKMAALYQEYSFKGIVFHYVPTSGMISGSSTALGSVMMQTSYRSTELPPLSKVELLNEYWSSESVPYESFVHPIECDPKENPFAIQYVRSGEVPTGDNKLLYDLGVTYIAVSGAPANVLGDIWVTYEVELKKPSLYSNVTSFASYSSRVTTGTTSTTYFDGLFSSFGTLGVTTAGRTLTLPVGTQGYVYINVYTSGVFSATAIFNAAPIYTNCAAWKYDGKNEYQAGAAATGPSQVPYEFGIFIADPSLSASILLPVLTFSGTITNTSVQVCLIN